MTNQVEKREHQIGGLTNVGLIALAFGCLSEAVRITAIDLGWIQQTYTTERALLVVWTVGLVGFGLAFGSVWVQARRLSRQERAVIADELAMFMSRRTAVWAFVATYLAAVVMAAVPAVADLPSRAVALAIVATATAALVVGRIITGRA